MQYWPGRGSDARAGLEGRATTGISPHHGAPEDDAYPADLLKRDFIWDEPGTTLVGDITYLRTGEGWLYLATIIDLATRMVAGWQMADHMRTSLVIGALNMAPARARQARNGHPPR